MRARALAALIAVGAGALPALAQVTTPAPTVPPASSAPKALSAPRDVTIPSPILTIDIDKLFAESAYGKRIEQVYADKAKALAAENRRIEAQLSQEEKDLTAKRATLSPEDFRKLADAFDAKVQAIRTARETKTRELEDARQSERDKFLQRVVPILGSVMRELGAVAILNRQTVFLSYHGIDVTDRAIRAIDAKIGDGSKPAATPETPGDTTGGGTTAPQGGQKAAPVPQPAGNTGN